MPPSRRDAYRGYVLAALTLMYVLNYLDRYVLTILVEPIKADLGTSDTVMGFLLGPAFALLYTSMGIPIARLADRRSRVAIVSVGLVAWSAFTALSGLARSTAQLALLRLGVGVGEAAGAAPAHSLIADYFPPESRARALGVFQLGVYIGQVLGLVAGGALAEAVGWRRTFLVVGLPGIAFALVLRATVREPRRPGTAADAPGLREVFTHLWRLRTFRRVALGTGLASFAGTGFGFWVPTLFVRAHGMTLTEVGWKFGLINGVSAGLGALLAGTLGDLLARLDVRWRLWIPALSVGLSLPLLVGISLWPTPGVALLLAVPSGIIGGGYAPVCYALVQDMAPPRMRAVAASVLIFFVTLLGMGLGPQAVGVLNDLLAPRHGQEAVRWSLVIVLSFSAIGALVLAAGARSVREDLAR